MKRILTVLGARPQFIKASVVSAALARHVGLAEIVVHTGQHFDANMSDVFFAELDMAAPQHHLGIHGGSHGQMTGRMLAALEDIMLAERPDIVMVYGDTNSTLAGAVAAAKLHIPIAHVEAVLRSHNMKMPEEVNRILADRISHWLFTPTDSATRNLLQEGAPAERIVQTGDVMFDVALQHGGNLPQLKARALQEGEGIQLHLSVGAQQQDAPVHFAGCVAQAFLQRLHLRRSKKRRSRQGQPLSGQTGLAGALGIERAADQMGQQRGSNGKGDPDDDKEGQQDLPADA